MLSNVYSKSYIQSSSSMHTNTKILLYDRFLPALDSYASCSKPFDAYSCFSAVTMDFVTSYQFGLKASSDLQRKPKFLKHFLGLYHSRHSYNFVSQELPGITSVLNQLGIRLVPKWVDEANSEIQHWTLQMCNDAAKSLKEQKADNKQEYPEVYAQLASALEQADTKAKQSNGSLQDKHIPRPYPRDLEIASEMLDHLAAGFETSTITLTYFVHEISKNPTVQDILRHELRTNLNPIMKSSASSMPGIPSAKTLGNLPYLDAALRETLRLRSAIPGPEPRVTPPSGCLIGPPGTPSEFFIPGNVRISAQAHSLHRNANIFKDPLAWKPERWLESPDERLKEMNRWFWAFGSGGRMCVGSNLAMYRKCSLPAWRESANSSLKR
jgi:cytochrome P450